MAPKINTNQLQALHQTIAEEAFMGFCTFDLITRQCVFLNKRARELLEVTDQDVEVELMLDEIFAVEPRGDIKTFNESLIAHEGLYQDILVRRTNSQTFFANVGIKRMNIDGQLLVLLMIQDMTVQKKLQKEIVAKQIEIKAAYEELLKQNRQLRELDIAKDRFVALTTHELRTPLSAMVASAEILHHKLYDTPEQLEEFITMIYEQGHHLVELVNDFLDFAKIQAGRMDFFIEQTSPAKLIESLAENFKSMAEMEKITILVQPLPSDLKCYFDELRLRQVLSNIVNNAIKYNRKGGQVSIRAEQSERHVKIFVTDTGLGIAADQIPKVFDEFETLGHVAQHHNGTGLGMPISRRLMEGMGGRLLVESTVGVGSTFWIEIPMDKVLAEEVYRPRPGGASGDWAA